MKIKVKAQPPKEKQTLVQVHCSDEASETLVSLLTAIQKAGNVGHSFSIVVDPGDSDYESEHFYDGDGSSAIYDVQVQQPGGQQMKAKTKAIAKTLKAVAKELEKRSVQGGYLTERDAQWQCAAVLADKLSDLLPTGSFWFDVSGVSGRKEEFKIEVWGTDAEGDEDYGATLVYSVNAELTPVDEDSVDGYFSVDHMDTRHEKTQLDEKKIRKIVQALESMDNVDFEVNFNADGSRFDMDELDDVIEDYVRKLAQKVKPLVK